MPITAFRIPNSQSRLSNYQFFSHQTMCLCVFNHTIPNQISNKMKKTFLFLFLSLSFYATSAQNTAASAPQSRPVMVIGAKAHLGNGSVIESSAVVFDGGKLTFVGTQSQLPALDKSKYTIIDATGKHVYPGFIAAASTLGLVEVESIRATKDMTETGDYNPNVRSLIAYNTDSEILPTVRANGVLLVQSTPQGGIVSGTSSVMELDGWNWEDAVHKADDGIHINWANMFARSGWWAEPGEVKRSEKYAEQVRAIENFFAEAKAYSQKTIATEHNQRFESMRGLFDGTKKLYIHTDFAKTITESVLFAKKYGMSPVIVDGADAWMVADFLKNNNVPVILHRTHTVPARDDEAADMSYRDASILQKAGVLFCFAMPDQGWQQRNLPFQAGTAVGFGLAYEEAVAAITGNVAKILGIEKTVGTLEMGKDATLFISDGDAIDMRSNHVTSAFIKGKTIDLDNKQKRLYKKFKEKNGK
jgi:imidazolonepropionase-like amidohydrolase